MQDPITCAICAEEQLPGALLLVIPVQEESWGRRTVLCCSKCSQQFKPTINPEYV